MWYFLRAGKQLLFMKEGSSFMSDNIALQSLLENVAQLCKHISRGSATGATLFTEKPLLYCVVCIVGLWIEMTTFISYTTRHRLHHHRVGKVPIQSNDHR